MMSRLMVVVVSVLSFASTSARAAEALEAPVAPPVRRNVVSLELPLQERRIAIEAERVLGPRVSVGLGVLAGFRHSRWRDSGMPVSGGNNFTQASVGLTPGARLFLTGAAPEGLWVAPGLEVSRGWSESQLVVGDVTGEALRGRQWLVGGTGLVGYSVVMEPGLVVQAGVGFKVLYTDETAARGATLGPDGNGSVSPETRQTYWDVTERVALNVGWAF